MVINWDDACVNQQFKKSLLDLFWPPVGDFRHSICTWKNDLLLRGVNELYNTYYTSKGCWIYNTTLGGQGHKMMMEGWELDSKSAKS